MASYEIIIKDQTGTTPNNPVANSTDDAIDPAVKRMMKKSPEQQMKAEREALMYIAMDRATSMVKGMINHELSMVSVETGRVELQQRIQVVSDALTGSVSLMMDIGFGAKVAGGWGAAVGALLNIAQTTVGIFQKADTINAQKNLENVSIGLKNVRSGGSLATYSQSRS